MHLKSVWQYIDHSVVTANVCEMLYRRRESSTHYKRSLSSHWPANPEWLHHQWRSTRRFVIIWIFSCLHSPQTCWNSSTTLHVLLFVCHDLIFVNDCWENTHWSSRPTESYNSVLLCRGWACHCSRQSAIHAEEEDTYGKWHFSSSCVFDEEEPEGRGVELGEGAWCICTNGYERPGMESVMQIRRRWDTLHILITLSYVGGIVEVTYEIGILRWLLMQWYLYGIHM